MPNKQRSVALLLMGMALLSLPCQKRNGIRGLDFSVAFSPRSLTDDLFADITYTWKTDSGFRGFGTQHPVFVLFEHAGRLLIRDDHNPEIPTAEWEPDREYSFTRKIYIPPFIDVYDPQFSGTDDVVLTVGLDVSPEEGDMSPIVVYRKKLKISPAPFRPSVIHMDGWYEPETDPDVPSLEWRWTAREARCLIDNPRRDALLVVSGAVDSDAVPGQKITLRIDGKVLKEFVPLEREFECRCPVSQDVLGEEKDIFLTISVDRTFTPADVVPGEEDTRELGVKISFLYFR